MNDTNNNRQNDKKPRLPLEGIRVVELGRAWVGPAATRILGDLGAEVIKVETVNVWPVFSRGIRARPPKEMLASQVPFSGGYPNKEPGRCPWNVNPLFTSQARNKLGMTVRDLREPKSREIFLRLIKVSDIFIENNQAETLDKLGLSYDVLKEVKPDIIIVVAYGELLKKEVLDIPSYGCINLHASLLPKYRGAAPVPWAILSGERITGVTTFFLDEGMDSGRMLLQEKVDINGDDTSLSLTEKLADEGAKLLVKSIQTIERGNFRSIVQNEEEVTFAPKIHKEHGYIKWNDTAEQIVRHVRAMFPWPGTFSVLYDKNEPVVLRLFDAELVSQKEGEPGQILEVDDSGMVIKTGSDAVRFKLLQTPGGNKMAPCVYARGHNLRPGIVLREKE